MQLDIILRAASALTENFLISPFLNDKYLHKFYVCVWRSKNNHFTSFCVVHCECERFAALKTDFRLAFNCARRWWLAKYLNDLPINDSAAFLCAERVATDSQRRKATQSEYILIITVETAFITFMPTSIRHFKYLRLQFVVSSLCSFVRSPYGRKTRIAKSVRFEAGMKRRSEEKTYFVLFIFIFRSLL